MASRLGKRLKRVVRRFLSPVEMEVWSIAVYDGTCPFQFAPLEQANNPVLTCHHVSDVPAVFVADPFMLHVDHAWYMFFEVMNQQTGKGEIGLAISQNGVKWMYQRIVLAEPFHLSYPYVFEWMNDYYMIPESNQAGSIRLYKASPFPTSWSLFRILVCGPYLVDASIFQYDNKWWIFTDTSPSMRHDTLRLYYADDLTGPWLEHPKSPIIQGNGHIARPAGRVLVLYDRIIRYAQDCMPAYGMKVQAFEVIELTTTRYRERAVNGSPVLAASGAGWNKSGMHHIDPHLLDDGRWMACVDGMARV